MRKMVSFFGPKTPVFEELNQRAAAYAAQNGFAYEWCVQKPFNRAQVIEKLQNADVGVIDIEPYNEEIFSQIKDSTKLLVRFGVGYDQVDLDAARRDGIAVARTTGANTMAVAEMAMSLIFALRRQLKENEACVASGAWEARTICNETLGSTVGVVGFGEIGRTFARTMKALGCRVLVYDPYPQMDALEDMGAELVALDDLFRHADAISIHVPHLPQTHHMVDARRLSLMKESAVLVNTARGHIVDEDALYNALKERKIRGAALDVYAKEPMEANCRFMQLDNGIFTPHVSGQTLESLWRVYAMAVDIAKEFFDTGASPHILNPVPAG